MKQRTRLSANQRITPPVLYAVQGDTGRELVARFRDYQIPAGATATISGRLPSGEVVSVEAAITDQTVMADLTALLTETGNVRAQLEISDGKKVTSFTFGIIVHEDFLSGYGYEEVGPADDVTFTTDLAAPLKSVLVTLTPQQSGSGTPSPDNVRPITGTEEVTVTRTGKNLLPRTASGTQTLNGVTFKVNDDGSVTMNGMATSPINWAYSVDAPVRLDGDYIISGINGGSASTWRFRYATKDASGTQSPWVYVNIDEQARTITGAASIFRFVILIADGTTLDNVTVYPMIRRADDTDPTYQPYNGETITTDLGRTVYGGTVDIVTGVLTVTHGYLALQDYSDWRGLYTAANGIKRFLSGPYVPGAKAVLSDYLQAFETQGKTSNETLNSIAITQDGRFTITPSFIQSATTAAEAKALLMAESPVHLVYLLATPETYQLTPAQVLALLGGNTIWSDAGQVTVKYRREAAA